MLLHAEEIDSLTNGNLDRRYGVLVDNIGDSPPFARVGFAAPQSRHDRECTVLLYVGVRSLVDEARLRIVLCLVRPGRDQVVVERGAAGRAAVRRAPFEKA